MIDDFQTELQETDLWCFWTIVFTAYMEYSLNKTYVISIRFRVFDKFTEYGYLG